jgi:hypothetical protein
MKVMVRGKLTISMINHRTRSLTALLSREPLSGTCLYPHVMS